MNLLMATFLVTVEILIGSYRFTRVNGVNIKNSWKNLADTCEIKLPYLKGKINKANVNESLADKIKTGDKVTVKMGYVGTNKSYEFTEFEGYVRRVNPNRPMEVICEDATWLLRRINLEKSWRNTTLKEVVQYIVDETNKGNSDKITLSSKIPEINFDKFTLDNVNGAAALQHFKDNYGLVAFFTGYELFVGVAFTNTSASVKLSLDWNVIDSSLTYRREEDNLIRIKAISIQKDNEELSVEVGPKEGELRTQFYYGITDAAQLKKLGEQDLTKLRFEGMEGTITCFLVPYFRHSMVADLNDPLFNMKQGKYIIDEVEVDLSQSGIRRTGTLGKRI